jgi:hypothetical protein
MYQDLAKRLETFADNKRLIDDGDYSRMAAQDWFQRAKKDGLVSISDGGGFSAGVTVSLTRKGWAAIGRPLPETVFTRAWKWLSRAA